MNPFSENITGLIMKLPVLAALLLIRLYKYLISPVLPPSCRFYPSCSTYAVEALSTHGFFRGVVLSVYRILRCNPWNAGGYDPVPVKRTTVK